MGIDFTEIPASNQAGISQDMWELFTEEFLNCLGLEIIAPPARGADGGSDIIAEETVHIKDEKKTIKWLVSCKHNAHSGSSVTRKEEQNIRDRIEAFGCDGFMGFYSTIANTSLTEHLARLKRNSGLQYKIVYSNRIANHIIGNSDFESLFFRYFPKSYNYWKNNFGTNEPIKFVKNFMKEKHSTAESVFTTIHGSYASFIKAVRNSKTFIEFLKIGDIKAVNTYTGLDPDVLSTISFNDIASTMKERAKVPKDELNLSCGFTFDSCHVYVLTSNHLIMSDHWHQEFKNSYKQLKEIIE